VKIADFGVAGWFQKPDGSRGGPARGGGGGGGGAGAARAGGAAEAAAGGGGGGAEEARTTFVGTPCWMAPEVMQANVSKTGYNEKVDVWSVGITALELVKGYAPYAKYKPMEVLLKTIKEPSPSLKTYGGGKVNVSESFNKFVARCLEKEPKDRCVAALQRGPFAQSVQQPPREWPRPPSPFSPCFPHTHTHRPLCAGPLRTSCCRTPSSGTRGWARAATRRRSARSGRRCARCWRRCPR
jgi:serine/threonine protein kinase